jgi:hypothetical protein
MDTQDTVEATTQNQTNLAVSDGLALLRKPFPDNHIKHLPKGTKEQNSCPAAEKRNCAICGQWHHPKVVHLSYVGHAAVTRRLLDADPWWDWEPMGYTEAGLPKFDESGGLWIKLHVCGLTRIGYGHAKSSGFDPGSREKEVIGDAIRNAAMRFGVALDLWHKDGDLNADKEEQAPKELKMVMTTKGYEHVPVEPNKAGQEQTPEELAVYLLSQFEYAKTAGDVEKTKELIRNEWPKIKGVTNMKESVVACAANAMARIREERSAPTEEEMRG